MSRINNFTQRDAQTALVATATGGAPGTDRRWRVLKATGSYSGSGVAGVMRIQAVMPDTSVVDVWAVDVPAGGGVIEDFAPAGGLQLPADAQPRVTLTSGGAGITGRVNVLYALEQ